MMMTQEGKTIRKRAIRSKFTTVFMLGVAVWICILSGPSLSFSSPKAQFTILYTNDVMGEVEPCG